jgi:hypothetical protein
MALIALTGETGVVGTDGDGEKRIAGVGQEYKPPD